jgi:predicted nuclease of predicted toxin-antitoxin system
MSKFLIDENLSPHLAEYLRSLGYEAVAVREVALKGKPDADLIAWIQKEKAILVTCDLDFGEFFYWQTLGKFGVIILRSKKQKCNSYKKILEFLHTEKILKDKRMSTSLLIASKDKYRLRKYITA